MNDLEPIFLLSLPRSGSTLVQRILAAHPEVATTPEPWVLLPQLALLEEGQHRADYGGIPATRAIHDFIGHLQGGEDAYRRALRHFALELYGLAGGAGHRYFLDKTPRYHFVVEQLFELFPDAKFVFLWRNPLAVVASMIETWGGGRWNLGRWRVDLYGGLDRLARAWGKHADRSHAVRYEDLVTDPMGFWPPLFDHLELSFDPTLLEQFTSVRLESRMGDPTGTLRYGSLSTDPLEKWRSTMDNPFRKRWCRRYLSWIGEGRLQAMGYRMDELREQLEDVPSTSRRIGADLAAMTVRRAARPVAKVVRSRRPASS